MALLRKILILTHRYLGIVLSFFFVLWFASGIGIMFSKGMPSLTPKLRLERLAPIDFSKMKLTPSDASQAAQLDQPPGRLTLLTVLDRPAYRIGRMTVFADNGDVVDQVGEDDALTIASRFMNLPADKLHYSLQTEVDEWTLGNRRQLPLHKFDVDDPAHTSLYVSPQSGDVVLLTTRGARALAWVAAIPHWLYFTKLRANDRLWQQVVLWSSGIGTLSALIGIILGFVQLKVARPFQFSKISSYIPYSGWMRWHYITGFIFGILTLTWVVSGFLSMQPGNWAGQGGLSGDIADVMTGGPLELANYTLMDAAAWLRLLPDRELKEIDFQTIQGESFYVARDAKGEETLIAANPLQIRREPYPVEFLMKQVRATYPDTPIVESQLLSDYDGYYYSQDRAAPLPVLRVKFGDPDRTWFYIDPQLSQLVFGTTHLSRIERWVYHGLHSLDFSFWYYNRPVWATGMVVLSLGGLTVSALGLYLGLRRVLRALRLA